uniref:glutathione transferase n=2 Tax=Aegilops tauschii TaxID=37682 RepID=A0A453JH80_AEGTS
APAPTKYAAMALLTRFGSVQGHRLRAVRSAGSQKASFLGAAKRPSARLVSAPAPLRPVVRASSLPPALRLGTAAAAAGTSTEQLGDELKVLGTWRSPFALRVRLALNFKGLPYEYFEEDLDNKSDLLFKSNPFIKKLPVLIHNNAPICESLVILEYIEEKFSDVGPSLLPVDPYERAMARFWARYIEDKLVAPWLKMFRANTNEEKAEWTRETVEAVKTLEGVLSRKATPFFGGDDVGYVDVVLSGMIAWMQGTKALCDVELLDAAKTPLLVEWTERFATLDGAKVVMPDVDKLVEFAKIKRAKMMALNNN